MGKRYEFHDDSAGARGSHKFWEICETRGSETYVKWGRCGTSGTGEWYDTDIVQDRESEKRSKGYKLVSSSSPKIERDLLKKPEPKTAPKDGKKFLDYMFGEEGKPEPAKKAPKATKAKMEVEMVAETEEGYVCAIKPVKADSDELEKILRGEA